jgi:hypothetical protein
MNSPLVREQAEKLFARIRPGQDEPLEAVMDRGYRIAFGRSPTGAEAARMLAFIQDQRAAMGGETSQATDEALVEFCHVLLCLNEFVYID